MFVCETWPLYLGMMLHSSHPAFFHLKSPIKCTVIVLRLLWDVVDETLNQQQSQIAEETTRLHSLHIQLVCHHNHHYYLH